jgi:peroxin-2
VLQEFLLFFLPIINTRKLKRSARKAVSKLRGLPILPESLRSDANEGATVSTGKFASLAEDQCAICAEDASTLLPAHHLAASGRDQHPLNTPYVTSCGHTYCYTCIADRMLRAGDEGEEYWECLRCDGRVKYTHRLEERIEEGTTTSEYSGFDLDEMSLNSEDTFGTFSSEGALSE